MLARCVLAAVLLSAGLPATASAAKKRFGGETAQSRNVRLVVNESGRSDAVRARTLRAFEVTFEQHCEHFVPALRGTWTFTAA